MNASASKGGTVAVLRCAAAAHLKLGPGTHSAEAALLAGAPAGQNVIEFRPGRPRRDAAGNLEAQAGWAIVDLAQLPDALAWVTHPASAALGVEVVIVEGRLPDDAEHACPACQAEFETWDRLVDHLELERDQRRAPR